MTDAGHDTTPDHAALGAPSPQAPMGDGTLGVAPLIDLRIAGAWAQHRASDTYLTISLVLGAAIPATLLFRSPVIAHGPIWACVWCVFLFGVALVASNMLKRERERVAARLARDLHNQLTDDDPASLPDVVNLMREKGHGHAVHDALAKLAGSLCASGHAGLVLRCVRDRDGEPAPPKSIRVPFEPVALHEASTMFEGVFDNPTERQRHIGDADEAKQDRRMHKVLGGHYRRVGPWRSLLGIRLVMTASFLFLVIMYVIHGVPGWLLLVLFVAGPLPLLLGFLRPSTGAQVWIFPGGVAVPKRHTRRRWRVIRRNEGAIVAYPSAGVLLAVADGKADPVYGTPAEIDWALRAWLSPLPPPSDDQLDAFFG